MNNLIKSIFWACFIFCPFIYAFSQDIKTYKGNYPLWGDFTYIRPEVQYSYYENADYKRIKHGSFKLEIQDDGGLTSNGTILIKGNYKNNLKHGSWTTTLVKKEKTRFGNATITISANYNEGIADGIWNYSSDGEPSFNLVFKFNKNIYVGDYAGQYKNNAFCDDEGYLHGTFTINENSEEIIKEYFHGILKKSIRRNKSTGDVLDKFQLSEDDFELQKR
jgi:hypothetical protein